MDQHVKQSIEGRKQVFFATYELDDAAKGKIDKLFAEIEKMGASCKDVTEFEAEFAKSPLNQKYMNLFTEISASVPVKGAAGVDKADVKQSVAEDVADKAISQLRQSTHTTNAAISQAGRDALRRVPILGDAIDVGEKASYVGHIASVFKKKKK